MTQARIAVSTLEPNPNPEPILDIDPDELPEQSGVVSAPAIDHLGQQVPSENKMPEERPTAPTIKVGPKRRGRPPKVAQLPAPASSSASVDDALQPLYAKVGQLAILAARAGKDVATFAHELRGLLDAYDALLKQL